MQHLGIEPRPAADGGQREAPRRLGVEPAVLALESGQEPQAVSAPTCSGKSQYAMRTVGNMATFENRGLQRSTFRDVTLRGAKFRRVDLRD